MSEISQDMFPVRHGPNRVILPKKDPQLEAERLYHETLIRKRDAFRRESVEFNLEKWKDTNDIIFEQQKINQINEFGQWYGTEQLTRLTRVILENPSSFDTDKDGNTLKDLSEVKEALVYTIDCQLEDGREASKGHRNVPKIMGFPSTRGTYDKPIVRWKYAKDGKTPIDGETIGHTTQYFIPFTKENVEDILSKYPLHKNFNSSLKYEKDVVGHYSCKSLEIFKNEKDGRAIIESNKSGFMTHGGDSAVENYRRFIEQKSAAEKEGKKVIVVDQETEVLLSQSGTSIEELAKEHIARQRSSNSIAVKNDKKKKH